MSLRCGTAARKAKRDTTPHHTKGHTTLSAFVVQDHTINRVLSTLNAHDRRAAETLAFAHDCATLDELGAAMFALNVRAVDARYGEGQAGEFRDLGYQFRLEMPVAMVAALKALNCWLYQCAEGDVPATPLYKAMDELSNRWAHEIVSRLPEYDRARWD